MTSHVGVPRPAGHLGDRTSAQRVAAGPSIMTAGPCVSLVEIESIIRCEGSPHTSAVRGAACTVPKLGAGSVARCFSAELGGSPVLVDHSTEDAITPDRGIEQGHRGGVVQWWVLGKRRDKPAWRRR
jgi:hypothetical protein